MKCKECGSENVISINVNHTRFICRGCGKVFTVGEKHYAESLN